MLWMIMKSLNHIIDASTPYSIFKAYIDSYSEYIGLLKFGGLKKE